MKAIALLSGGLDSTLAAKLILQQGIEVEAVSFSTVFSASSTESSPRASEKAANALGIRLKVFEISKEYLQLLKRPQYGYGKNLNPCIDCRIFMLNKTKEYMRERGASFLITGEVLGERPMSQHRNALMIIDRDAEVKGSVLRPLSARLLEPTIPEKEGWVDREKLLDFRGRSRKPQIALAHELNIRDYPSPAGGCLLTDPGFSRRMKDLMESNPHFTINDVQLLKIGRHFRFSPKSKLIVGRNESENMRLTQLMEAEDIIFNVADFPSALSILRGEPTEDELSKSAAIAAWYSKARQLSKVKVRYYKKGEGGERYVHVEPLVSEVARLL